jgi:hypothetical protein
MQDFLEFMHKQLAEGKKHTAFLVLGWPISNELAAELSEGPQDALTATLQNKVYAI